MSEIRVRIAPSPTGPLHVGTARSALFNYLFARRYGGKFVLRIEDTDLERSDKKYEQNIFDGLRWLGIEWDEGPTSYKLQATSYQGPYAPYRQTERIDTYARRVKTLLEEGKAFYCFHSEAELEDERQKLMEAKHPPIHLCEYRNLDPEEARLLTETKNDYIIRFKTPAGRTIAFTDIIRGKLSFASELLGDFSIAKRADAPLYNFAVVIDDYEMKISHVIRGEDHIPNTPKQMLLAEALGFPAPEYGHLPLVFGKDRSKLSKRHGATSIEEYRKEGYLPEALFNFIALLGWNPGDNQEIFSKEELIKKFTLDRVQKSGAVFDVAKLDWMNGEYIRKKTPHELIRQAQSFLDASAFMDNKKLEKIIALEQPRLKKLSEISEKIDFFLRLPEYDKELLRWKTMTDEEVAASLDISIELLKKNKKEPIEKIEIVFLRESAKKGDRGWLLWPLRAALSGKKASPGPFEIINILGIEEAVARIQNAIDKLNKS